MPSFKFNGTELKLVKEYKYLGTTVTNTGNFKLNEINLKKKGLRGLPFFMGAGGYEDFS